MNISSVKHKRAYHLKGSLRRSSIPFGVIQSQIKELPLCSNQGSAIFKAGGKYQVVLGATHRKYEDISLQVTQRFIPSY
jgi:hypothetical protein